MATSILTRFALIVLLSACGGGDPEETEPAHDPNPTICEVEPRPTYCL
jgi:hypothetical protein